MKRTVAVMGALLAFSACGGTKTVYVTNTEAPDTTTKSIATTDAPRQTVPMTMAPPVSRWTYAEEEFFFDIENNYGPIYMDKQELVDTGQMTCTALRAGATGDDIITAIMSSGGYEFVVTVVASAVANFCPDQAWKFQ